MDSFFGALESFAVAEYLRTARWSYAAVNAAHILGIALLVGAITPLNLRFLGLWNDTSCRALVRILLPVAGIGLVLALATGTALFTVRALDYRDNGFLQLKIVLIALGALSAIRLHWLYGWSIGEASKARLVLHGLVSSVCWIGALVCGRLIAFLE